MELDIVDDDRNRVRSRTRASLTAVGSGEDGLDEVVDVLLERSFRRQQSGQVDLGDHLAFATFPVLRVDFLRLDQMPQFQSVIRIQRFRRRVRRPADAATPAETLRPAQIGERGVARVGADAVATGSHRRRHRPPGRNVRVVVPRGPVAVVTAAAVVVGVEVVSAARQRRREGAQRSIVRSLRQRGKIERLLRHDRQQGTVGDAWKGRLIE